MLQDFRLNQTNRPLDALTYWRDEKNMLLLNPPYQRGDVWGVKRQRNLIKSLLLGVPIPSIIINDRMRANWPDDDFRIAVIDGKQRITAIFRFLDNQLEVPGDWFGELPEMVTYGMLPKMKQRKFENRPIAFSDGWLTTVEQEKMVFDLVNFGGLSQGEIDDDIVEPAGEKSASLREACQYQMLDHPYQENPKEPAEKMKRKRK